MKYALSLKEHEKLDPQEMLRISLRVFISFFFLIIFFCRFGFYALQAMQKRTRVGRCQNLF